MTARIIAALMAAALAVFSFPALADHANWIHEKHSFCCIPNEDCHPYKANVGYDGKHFTFTWKDNTVRWPEKDTRLSEDQDYWVCEDQYLGGIRCFFRPRMGT